MTQRLSAPAWLLWTGASAFLVLVTRNPLYLTLVLISVLAVYLTLEHRSAVAFAWSTVLRIGVVIAGLSILFNVLTVHSGDRQFGSLPSSWPIIGGPLTLNAVLYGTISGLALLCLLLIAATLSTAVERSAFVRMLPQSMGAIAVAAAVALSMFPQTITAISQVREAHRARGMQIRTPVDIRRLIVPVLNIGLERAFALAESMESRAFGNRVQGSRIPTPLTFAALMLSTAGVVLFGIGYPLTGILSIATSIALIFALAWKYRGPSLARYRVSRLSRADVPVVITSSVMFALTAFELTAGESLSYSTYPTLQVPGFTILNAVAAALPALPALMTGVSTRPEPANA